MRPNFVSVTAAFYFFVSVLTTNAVAQNTAPPWKVKLQENKTLVQFNLPGKMEIQHVNPSPAESVILKIVSSGKVDYENMGRKTAIPRGSGIKQIHIESMNPESFLLILDLKTNLKFRLVTGKTDQLVIDGIISGYNQKQAEKNYQLGLQLQKENKHWEALGAFRKAISLNKNFGNAFFKAGQIRYRLKQLTVAKTNFIRALNLGCDSLNVYRDLAKVYRDLHQTKLAEKYEDIFRKKKDLNKSVAEPEGQNLALETQKNGVTNHHPNLEEESGFSKSDGTPSPVNDINVSFDSVSFRLNWANCTIGSKIYFQITDVSSMVVALQKSISLEKVNNTDIFKIFVKSESPNTAQMVANMIADQLIQTRVDLKKQTVRSSYKFLDERLEDVSRKLKKAEKDLSSFQSNHSLISIDESSRATIEFLNKLESNKVQIDLDINEYENRLAGMKNELSRRNYIDQTYLAPRGTTGDRGPFSVLFQELASTELERLQLLQRRKETHPDVVALTEKINQIKRKLATYNKNSMTAYEIILNTLKGKQRNIDRLISRYSQKIQKLPAQEAQLVDLTRKRDLYDKMYSLLFDKREEMRMSELSQIQDLVIIDSARRPVFPKSSKRRLKVIMAALVGLSMGLLAILFLEMHGSKITNIDEIEDTFQLPILTAIPNYDKKLQKRVQNSGKIEESLVSLNGSQPAFKEAYRNLRTKLLNIYPSTLKTIMITSIEENAGKTTVTANFAVSLARLGKRVLVVDCDLRKSQLADQFKITESHYGLGDFLTKNIKLTMFHPLEFFSKGKLKIDFLPAGRFQEESSELLGSEKMKKLMRAVQFKYDYILLDTPPLSSLVDAFVLGKMAKNVILVIRPNITKKESLSWAIKEFDQSNVNLLGFVVNDFDPVNSSYKFKYGYGYADKYKKPSQTRA